MKKLRFLIIVTIFAGAIVFFLSATKNIEPGTKNLQQGGQGAQGGQTSRDNEIKSLTDTIVQSDAFYNIRADYPQFGNINPSFNNAVKDFMAQRIDAFKQEVRDNFDSVDNPPQAFDFISGWKQTQLGEKYISISINIGSYAGGATTNEEIKAFNYDIKNDKQIEITDFLGNGAQDMAKLSQLSRQRVTSKLEEMGVMADQFVQAAINAGTMPDSNNFSEFNFTPDSLIIYFQKYQVAPGAAGPITITISKSELVENGITSVYLN